MTSLVFYTLLLALSCTFVTTSNTKWDYLAFSQMWPQTGCIYGREEGHRCKLNKNITTWTIHGLWPNLKGSMTPVICNDSIPFNKTAIQPLLPKLLKYWPNTYLETEKYNFWIHEWKKHGRCAINDPLLNGEYNYFSAGLKLNRKFDILRMLNKGHIYPDENKKYKAADIVQAIKAGYGQRVSIKCIYDNATKTHYLYEVVLCLNKKLVPIDCPKPPPHILVYSFGKTYICKKNTPIKYPPLVYGRSTWLK